VRSLRLLGAAAEAESLRLRRQAAQAARRGAFYAVAGLFGLAAVIMLHVAGWISLMQAYGSLVAALVLAGIDLVIMGLVLFIGRARPDPVAQAALVLRERSMAEFHASPLFGFGGRSFATSFALAETIARTLFKKR
jgi:hypothetical protein